MIKLSRLRSLFCVHFTQVTNGFHHMSRTFFWRTQFIRNMNNPCENNMTFKLRYIDMQILIQHFRRQLQISVHKKFSTEMQKQKKNSILYAKAICPNIQWGNSVHNIFQGNLNRATLINFFHFVVNFKRKTYTATKHTVKISLGKTF